MRCEGLPNRDHDANSNSDPNDWREIDRTLRGLAQQRAALDAAEAHWLRAAYRVQIWRELGCVSMVDYMERYLGYGVRNAQERLKVALALDSLPARLHPASCRSALSACFCVWLPPRPSSSGSRSART